MKRIFKALSIILVLVIFISLASAIPISAANGTYSKIQTGFTLDPGQPGTLIERGSTIYHLETGITEVYDANNTLTMTAVESETGVIMTSYGPKKATDIYHLPDGARVDYSANITKIYDGYNLILTVVYNQEQSNAIPNTENTHGWLGTTQSHNLMINYCDGCWGVPNAPPDSNDVAFYFNGIQSATGATLLQPLLQWNQAGYQQKWSIQSSAIWPNGGVSMGPVTVVTKANLIEGQVSYVQMYNGWYWMIQIRTLGGSWTGTCISGSIMGQTNDTALTALEVWRPDTQAFVNNDLPGCCSFVAMTFRYNGNSVPINWTANTYSGLNLSISYDHSSAGSYASYVTPN